MKTIESLKQHIKDVAPKMAKLRRTIHQYPEPAYQEFETAKEIVRHLETVDGLDVSTGIGRTGIVAVLGREKNGPCIALRADMDCLYMQEENNFPHASQKQGLMHGCGHDGHIACLVGAIKVLAAMENQLRGPVKFLFQPGEENAAGAKEMIKDGALENPRPKAIFGLHGTPSLPFGTIGLRSGAMMAASRYFKIIVSGKGTHAAMPHKGVDTVLAASHIVCAAHSIVSRNISPMEAALISIPKFEASRAPNVLPKEVVLEGTLRALSNGNRDYLEQRLKEVAVHTASAFGACAEVEFDGGYPLLENDPKCYQYVLDRAIRLVGKDKTRDDYPPSLGAEDFAFYLKEIPGAFCWIGLGSQGANDTPLHNPTFDFNDDVIEMAIELHCRLALDFHLL